MPVANHLLHRLIRETGWTYEALARRLNTSAQAAGLTTGYDRTSVAHWLRGSTPRDPVPGLLCEILAARLNRPVGPADIGMHHAGMHQAASHQTAPAHPGADPAGGGPAPGLHALAAELLATVPGLHPHRRPRHGGETHRVPEQRDRPDAGQVPALSHTELRRAAENFFTGQVDALGGDATAPVLLAYLQSTFRTALTATGDERSLSAMEIGHAARTVLLLARSYADQCSFAEARRTLSRAASLAELAGEPSTQAIALRMLSQDALDQNQPAVALSYVRRALEIAPRAPDAVRAFVAAQAAQVHAVLGDRAEALAWLDAADLAQGAAAGEPDPFHTYRPAALEFKRAVVLGLLGDHPAAHAALDASLASRPAQQERAIMLTHVERARLYRLGGHEREAAAELRYAQALNRGVHSPRAAREIELLGPA
ncbi:tetratricopeptide repeat protein [Streptomyces sp. NBC_00335]|uniref:tetratricopeptide repeat protein n=1 Tax=unclassified Streptomyces TaxID=2593676 RepID=UPI00224EC7C0|nr:MULTISPECIES: tetratricopeptide repeat protein [unclassified Streptomyces]MCX5409447.1 tetratricopeptide repeat protein [Streptomyces sp. NBC_00086]